MRMARPKFRAPSFCVPRATCIPSCRIGLAGRLAARCVPGSSWRFWGKPDLRLLAVRVWTSQKCVLPLRFPSVSSEWLAKGPCYCLQRSAAERTWETLCLRHYMNVERFSLRHWGSSSRWIAFSVQSIVLWTIVLFHNQLKMWLKLPNFLLRRLYKFDLADWQIRSCNWSCMRSATWFQSHCYCHSRRCFGSEPKGC